MRVLIFVSSLLVFAACTAKIGQHIINPQPRLADTAFVLVLRQSDDFTNDGMMVGRIQSGDTGFSTDCSYQDVLEELKSRARKNGANLIKITKRLAPDRYSTCERITAELYLVPDYRKHELEIQWSAGRKLTWEDFKGQPATVANKLWFEAASMCDINMESNAFGLLKKPKFYTSAQFLTFSSWVHPTRKSDALLAHEQLHFDIAELFRRKLQRQLDSSELKFPDAEAIAKNLARQVSKAYHNEQAIYDEQTQHGRHATFQQNWAARIDSMLKK